MRKKLLLLILLLDVSLLFAAYVPSMFSSSITLTPMVGVTRSLNSNFQPNANRAMYVCYTIEILCTANLSGGQTGTVELRSDENATPTTVRASVSNGNSVSLAIALTAVNTQKSTLCYMVPPGHYVRLASASTGSPSISLVNQTEIMLSP